DTEKEYYWQGPDVAPYNTAYKSSGRTTTTSGYLTAPGNVAGTGGPGNATTDYAPLVGINYTLMASFNSKWPYPSPPTVLQKNEAPTILQVTDGTSNSVVMVECAGRATANGSYYGKTQIDQNNNGGGWASTDNGLTPWGYNQNPTVSANGGPT